MNNLQNIELLAPAGGVEQLHAAINFGADAVYLAGKMFGMRAKASNFEDHELKEAVEIAHKNNVKVYVTCNILMHDSDIDNIKQYFMFLEKIGCDAVIVSDLGAFSVAKKFAKNLNLHISTQASVSNTQSAIAWANLGAKRIVLAREMSIDEISLMRKKLDRAGYYESKDNPNSLSLEVFVHGAMCMSVSGRCLISSYLTGRSANKGLCTQPCRWGYNLEEENRIGQKFHISEDNYGTYIMNSKDLNMLMYLDKLIEAGVSSFKIEGRNKKAMYVATVVNAYRHVIEYLKSNCENKNLGHNQYQNYASIWNDELLNISHRPYSTGFYFNEAEQSHDYDGYEQNCVHVADCLECYFDIKTNCYEVKVLCRNRFEENQTLQVLIPHKDIMDVDVKNLRHINSISSNIKNTKIANRAKDIYLFNSDVEIKRGSILRSNMFIRTSRKE